MKPTNYKRETVKNGKKTVIVSLADVPFPLGQGLELMVMKPDGTEIEVSYPESVYTGMVDFKKMVKKYGSPA